MLKVQVSLIMALLLLPRGSAQHEVDLKFDNPTCKNDKSCVTNGAPSTLPNCLCSTQVYRAKCNSPTDCPNSASGFSSFTLLPNTNNLTILTDSTGTHYKYADTDAALVSGSPWIYAVRNNWSDQTTVTNPSSFANTDPIMIPVGGTVHKATLNYSSTDCNLNKQCWIQLYRAVCNPTCPDYRQGSSSWTDITDFNTTTLPYGSTDYTRTIWQLADADPALAANTKYVYVTTLCFQPDCIAYSHESVPWSGTTSALKNKKGQVAIKMGGRR